MPFRIGNKQGVATSRFLTDFSSIAARGALGFHVRFMRCRSILRSELQNEGHVCEKHKESSMARDSRNALVALNRFGFGARGGAAGDLINAGSDPRGFVMAELNYPNAARLEIPGLQPTPELTQAVFAFQDEQKAKREAVAKTAAVPEAPKTMTASEMQEGSGGTASMQSQEKMQAKP